MSPEVFRQFAAIAASLFPGGSASRVLEVGAGGWTLLSMDCFTRSQRVAVNLRFGALSEQLAACDLVVANGNALPFMDGCFDCVMSSSALEHDKYFWSTAAEVRRVLRPGGAFIVGVPIYKTLPTDKEYTTLT